MSIDSHEVEKKEEALLLVCTAECLDCMFRYGLNSVSQAAGRERIALITAGSNLGLRS